MVNSKRLAHVERPTRAREELKDMYAQARAKIHARITKSCKATFTYLWRAVIWKIMLRKPVDFIKAPI